MSGPYREVAAVGRCVPISKIISEEHVGAYRDGATKLVDKLSSLATTLVDHGQELSRWRVALPDTRYTLRVVQGWELATELDDIRRRLMLVVGRASALAAGEEEFTAELPETKKENTP